MSIGHVRLLLRMDMKSRFFCIFLLWIILLSAAFASCMPAPSESISLASFTENYVEVSIDLEHSAERIYALSATFTPPDGYHLYSKDIPISGVNDLGRPTLLELTTKSQMRTIGELTESAKAKEPDFEPKELLVYPPGAVTLSLPVELPPGKDWINDELEVTYMACSASQCKPPVVAKIVLVRIPGADMFDRE
jgi:hypothetical protein